MQLNLEKIAFFKQSIWDFYKKNGRQFSWRSNCTPYEIVISEIMLQQTQTDRVSQKFPAFIKRFPSFQILAQAPLRDVLSFWQGLGYNRRGKYVHQIAKKVINEFSGKLPKDPQVLIAFPGIGKNTAGSICAFAFNKPTIFIETNIRSVFIHFFFLNREAVHDKDIIPLIEATVDNKNPREWYYALMDYGVMLKKSMPNPSRKSVHHTKQSKFEGSDRQIRGMILKLLVKQVKLSNEELNAKINRKPQRIKKALTELCNEGLIQYCQGYFTI